MAVLARYQLSGLEENRGPVNKGCVLPCLLGFQGCLDCLGGLFFGRERVIGEDASVFSG
jgi:hypothetical protein